MTLTEIRAKIDAIDVRLLDLLNERADLVHEVGLVKRKEGVAVYAPEREEQLLRSLVQQNRGRLPANSIRAIYREIMSASLALEKDLAIAFAGPEGTWAHHAARIKFGASVRYSPQPAIAEVFEVVADGKADYGVVPLESSTPGEASETIAAFFSSDLHICAQIPIATDYELIGHTPLAHVRKVYAQPLAFAHCAEWLRHNLPAVERAEVPNAAAAAELAATEPAAAALAGKLEAELHRIGIIADGIHDPAARKSRFLVIGLKSCPVTGEDKTSLLFAVPRASGALCEALKPLVEAKVSITKIESRGASPQGPDPFFFIDADGHPDDPILGRAIDAMRVHTAYLRVLGSYPRPHGS